MLFCVAVYKAFILGNYYGEAIHVVAEVLNDSYDYYSSEGENLSDIKDDSSSKTAYRLNEGSGSEDSIPFRNGQHSLQNPESLKGDPLSGARDTKSIRSLEETNGARGKKVRGKRKSSGSQSEVEKQIN